MPLDSIDAILSLALLLFASLARWEINASLDRPKVLNLFSLISVRIHCLIAIIAIQVVLMTVSQIQCLRL